MNEKLQIRNSTAEFLIFATQNESDTIEVRFEKETLWLSQKWMAKLFDCTTDNISLHLKNIFASGELEPNSVAEDFSATAADGKTYRIKHYNLDAIIAVGYRVNSRLILLPLTACRKASDYVLFPKNRCCLSRFKAVL